MSRLSDIGRSREDDTQIDIAPLVDIVFLLLLFFILTSTFRNDKGFNVALPEARNAGQTEQQQDIVTVVVLPDGVLRVGELDVSQFEALSEAVKDKKEVALKADREARYDFVIRAMDLLKQAGVQDVILSTDAPKAPASPTP